MQVYSALSFQDYKSVWKHLENGQFPGRLGLKVRLCIFCREPGQIILVLHLCLRRLTMLNSD